MLSSGRHDIGAAIARSGQYLRRLAELLPNDFGDADVWRAAHVAAREVMQAPRKSA